MLPSFVDITIKNNNFFFFPVLFINFFFYRPPVVVFMGAFHCKSCQNGEDVTNIFGHRGSDGDDRRRFMFGRHRSRSAYIKETDSLVLQTLSIIKNLGLIDK